MIRTFVAVELEHDLRQAIGRLQEQLKDRMRGELQKIAPDARLQWVRAESIHLTLKFLGDVEESLVETICRVLTDTTGAWPPFLIEAQGLGVFPDLRAPRVLWIGLADQNRHGHMESLTRLAEDVDQALLSVGCLPEGRPFNPHLTLARIKEKSREIGHAFRESGLLQHASSLGTLRVHTIALMKSDLKPTGSVYTVLCRARLGQ